MKKFLSMVLALVMTMSLVTVSAGAKDFNDGSQIKYQEAVDVMSAAKVLDGYTDGSFKPQAQLTRGAAAKIICNLVLGPTTASALNADTAPYKDVPANHDFAGYIAYCKQQKIIDGYPDHTFRPAAPLSSYAFMKMLLGALGYDGKVEGYSGSNWSIAVAKRALQIGLDDGLDGKFVGTNPVTREEAALYALNTLTATMVEYENRVVVDNVVIAGSEVKPQKWNTGTKYDGRVYAADGFIQFAEQYFTDLRVSSTTDTFERPADEWVFDGEKVGVYTDKADKTYTTKVKANEIWKDLNINKTIDAKYVTVMIDGAAPSADDQGDKKDMNVPTELKKVNDDVSYGANGVKTEVFYDADANNGKGAVTITEINTWTGEVIKTVAENSKHDAHIVIAPDGGKKPAKVNNSTIIFETNDKFEDDARILYTYSLKDEEVVEAQVAQMVSGNATRTENKATNTDENKAIYLGETAYKFSNKNSGTKLSDVSVGNDYDAYLDAYGYVIYIDEVEEIGDYAMLLNYQDKKNFSENRALLIFSDGTEKVVSTAKNYKKPGDNFIAPGSIVTYKEDKGTYTLKPVAMTVLTNKYVVTTDPAAFETTNNTNDFQLDNSKAAIVVDSADTKYVKIESHKNPADVAEKLTVNANSSTVFVVYNTDDEEYTVYTGIKNAPNVKYTSGDKTNAAAYVKNGMTKIMFIFADNDNIEDASKKMLFLAGESVSNLIHTNAGDYFEYNAVVNGEITTVKVDKDVTVGGVQANALNGLFKSYAVDSKGIITRLSRYDNFTNGDKKEALNPFVTGVDKRSADYTVVLGAKMADGKVTGYDYTFTVNNDEQFFYVDEKGNITKSSYKYVGKDDDDKVYAVIQDFMVQALVIEEVDKANNNNQNQNTDPTTTVALAASGQHIKVTTTDAPQALTPEQQLAAVRAELKKAGWEILGESKAGTVTTFSLAKGVGSGAIVFEMKYDTANDYTDNVTFTVNGNKETAKRGDKLSTAMTAKYGKWSAQGQDQSNVEVKTGKAYELYVRVEAMTSNGTSAATKGVQTEVKTNNGTAAVFVKKGETVTYSVTLKGTATDDVTVTLSAGTWGTTMPAGVTREGDTVLKVANTTAFTGAEVVTATLEVTTATDVVATTATLA